MNIESKENIIGLISNRSTLKAAATQSIKKPVFAKKALADVGNIINSAKKKKDTQEFLKPGISGQTLEGTKNFKVHVEDEDIMFSPAPKKTNTKRIPLSPISGTTTTTAALNPCYQYDIDDGDDDDGHVKCSGRLINDDFDDFLPVSLRLNSDDFNSLTMFKPPEELLETNWKRNISVISDDSDLNDLNVPFPSPPKFSDFDLPFNEFVVPGINFDDSF